MQTILRIGITYLILLITFTLLMIATYCIPKNIITANTIRSTKTLQEEGVRKRILGSPLLQLDNFTDACMLNLEISNIDKHPIESAMMNYYWIDEDTDFAYSTEKAANNDFTNLEKFSYARYWQGHQVFLRILLTIMDYSQIRIFNYILFTLLSMLCFYLIYKKINGIVCILFILSLLLIGFPIIPLSLQYSTCFYISLISMICLMIFRQLTVNITNQCCSFFIIGGITSFFDFLTTPQLTLGLPLIIYILTYNPDKKWRKTIILSCCWILGYALLWSSKWMIGYFLTGNDLLTEAMDGIRTRTSNIISNGNEITFSNVLNYIWRSFLKHRFSKYLITFILTFILIYGLSFKGRKKLKEYSFLIFIALFVPIWYILLPNHSIVHWSFTWRALLLTIFSLIIFIYYTTDITQIYKRKKYEQNSSINSLL